jgi:hypothetical protein
VEGGRGTAAIHLYINAGDDADQNRHQHVAGRATPGGNSDTGTDNRTNRSRHQQLEG